MRDHSRRKRAITDLGLDALLEAGHPELAEHFRDAKEWHPKGCWVVDLLLGKT